MNAADDLGWGTRLDPTRCAELAAAAVEGGWLDTHDAVLIHDLDVLAGRLHALRQAFPPRTLHSLAVKANPVVAINRHAVAHGAGLECASIEEVEVARRAGCPDDRIVFDSPAKTRRELTETLAAGLWINANDPAELERLDELDPGDSSAHLGLRINPEVGAGKIAATSVGQRASKFGVPLSLQDDAILPAFDRYPWLRGLHVHVGSQGCDLDLLAEAARRIERLAETIEARHPGRLTHVDLGGGLPVAYTSDHTPPRLRDYVAALHEAAPRLMSPDLQRITEFGRGVHANAGVALSRVEYVRRQPRGTAAILHLGADLLLRPVYNPDDWRHEFLAFDPQGRPKTGPTTPCDLGGPLCFGGDFIGRDVSLPPLEPGDLICIRDTGAYTLSMWSRHCSRSQPPVLGASAVDGLTLLRPGETPASVAAQWDDPTR